jgi:TolA-binding protein
MKWLSYSLMLAMLCCPACSNVQNAQGPDESQKNEAAKQDRQQYQDQVEAKLRELDREIDELKAKAEKHGKEAQKQYDQQRPELERKRKAAQQEFEKLKNSSREAWQDMKAGIDAAMDNLESAYDKAASHFK